MFVITVSSLKGGVGKTTVSLGLASAALNHGLRTLVVDFDPQADVSTGLDVDLTASASVTDVLSSPTAETVRSAIVPSGWVEVLGGGSGKLDVMVGSPTVMNFYGPHPSARDLWKLEEALAVVEADYDLVIVDCEASINALTRTAWTASDRVLVIAEPSLFGVSAADRVLRAIEDVRREVSPRLQPLGVIVNRVRPKSAEAQFRIKEIKEMVGPLLLSPILPERTSLHQTQGAARPVHSWPTETGLEMAKYFDDILNIVIESQNHDLSK